MRYLACELPQATIARNLHLSVKTVSKPQTGGDEKTGFQTQRGSLPLAANGRVETVERPRGEGAAQAPDLRLSRCGVNTAGSSR